jgi:hypothetical protein
MAWIPCVRRAKEGSRFCRRHGEAIFGAMLGALVYEEGVEEMVHLCNEKEPCGTTVGTRKKGWDNQKRPP